MAVVLWASAAGGQDDTLEVPLVRQAEQREPAHEVSRLRAWDVREGRLDATPTPRGGKPTPVPDVPDTWVVPDTGVQGDAVATGQRPIEALIRAYDWDDATALRIARCESGDDLHAEPWENWYHRGPFQVSYIHAWRHAARGWDWDTASDEQHIAVAYEIWLEQSWWPWRFSTLCHGVY